MSVAFNEPRYQIEVSNFRCRGCETEIPCEAAYYSAVHFEGETFERRNYCASCWTAGDPAGPASVGVFAFWRSRRPPLPSDKPRKVRFDSALIHQFFLRLGAGLPRPSGIPVVSATPGAAEGAGGDAPAPLPAAEAKEREDLRFVLALLLIRKKVLDFASSREDGGVEWLKLETRIPKARRGGPAEAGEGEAPEEAPPAEPAVHWVKSPQLTDAELERVKLKIGELLQVEL
jgi:hypothetical protein